MKVFVTGASGFIGTEVVRQLIAGGHKVLGLARSDESARALEAQGATVHRGSLTDPDSLRAGAAASDGVIHTAFDHDFSNFVANCDKDRRAIEALGAGVAGSNRPLLITSGTGMGSAAHGQPASEDVFNPDHPNPRKASEIAGVALSEKGVNVSVIRLPQVHDTRKQGLITPLIEITRAKGMSAYVGDGQNRWPAVHLVDAARVYVLALEKAQPNARYNPVGEEGITARQIAETIGHGLKVAVKSITPEEVPAHFGWMAMFAGLDMPASSALTQQRLDWKPTGPGLIEDLKRMNYSAA